MASIAFDPAGQQPLVHTSCGTIAGMTNFNGSVAAFRGIPYAEPPVGPRRFQPSVLAKCWSPLTLNATGASRKRCWQFPPSTDEDQSEDCLTLDVFAPSSGAPAELVPVLFFIHGGMNTQGSARSYGPIERLVPRLQQLGMPHVLVAVQYRLNALGFLALEELAEADTRGVSGNYGITDLLTSLRWVRAHVSSFGGDAARVTLVGQSSGASNIYALMASPSSVGLFHRAVALSGSPNISMSRPAKQAQDRALYVPRSPCASTPSGPPLVHCLQAAPAKSLVAALPASYATFATLYDYPVDRDGLGSRVHALLFVDGVTVATSALDSLRAGLNDVPLLLQSAQAEMDCYPDPTLSNLSAAAFEQFVAAQLAPSYGTAVAAGAAERYLGVASDLRAPAEMAVYALDADTASGCGLLALSRAAADSFASPVYLGTVVQPPGRAPAAPSATRYAFHNWDFQAASDTHAFYGYEPTADDEAFGMAVLSAWANLSYYGRLADTLAWRAVREAPGWPAHYYSSQVGADTTTVLDLKASLCAWWDAHGVGQNWWWIN